MTEPARQLDNYPVVIVCDCTRTLLFELAQACDDSWGLFGEQTCICGATLAGDTIGAAYRSALRAYRIVACDSCGSRVVAHGLCTDCRCACCGEDRAECGCRIRTVEDRDDSVGYSAEITWCDEHCREV